MVKDSLKKLIENIDYNDLKDLKKEATRKLSFVRSRDRLYFRIYLQKEFVEKFERAKDWAFTKGLIKKKTRWSFAKFAIMNIIDQIITEIDKEQLVATQSRSSAPLFAPERDGEVRQD